MYKKQIRTTSACESYNGHLNSKLSKLGSFWKFLDLILEEDFKMTVDLKNSVDGICNIFERPKTNKYKKRADLIKSITISFDEKKINLKEFLNKMTNWQNNLLNLDTYDIDEEGPDDSADCLENSIEPTITSQAESLLCIICCERQRTVLLQPCNHYKLCAICYKSIYETAIEKKTKFVCPYCRQIVKQSCNIFA